MTANATKRCWAPGCARSAGDLALKQKPTITAGQPRTAEPLASRQPSRGADARVRSTTDHDLALVCSLTGSRADRGHDRQTELIAVLCVRRDAHHATGQHNRLPGVERAGGDRSGELKPRQPAQPTPPTRHLLDETRPTRKPVLTCDHQLRGGQAHRQRIGVNIGLAPA